MDINEYILNIKPVKKRKSKLEEYKNEIGLLHKNGYSSLQIKDFLSQKYKINITPRAILYFISKNIV